MFLHRISSCPRAGESGDGTIDADAVAEMTVTQDVFAVGNGQRRAAAAGRRLVELLERSDS